MTTVSEKLKEIEAEPNAVKAADLGLEAVQAFVHEASANATGQVKEYLDNLLTLVEGLRKAVPANVTPASAGPVGKSPHEHYLEQAATIVEESLAKMREALAGVHKVLEGVNEATQHAIHATAAIQSPDLKGH